MRIRTVIIGLVLVLISVPGYLDTPTLMSQMVHYMMGTMMGGSTSGSIPGAGSGSILKQMGYPSRSTVVPLIQYSFVGLALTGLGFMVFGALAKKISSQVTVNLVTGDEKEPEKVEAKKVQEIRTSSQFTDERIHPDNRSLRILQERLAKGDITANEYQNLKKLLE
ncbi:MAG TPA: SHOCT domain-containing protein [Nitrosopumilaceae archaeon]|nr:SHOCT domain-containing protein [Nitrosopumilaceae archaeon]